MPLNKPKVLLLSDFPSAGDEAAGSLFVGESGKELARMLNDSGINFKDCYITSVFKHQPPGGDIANWCVTKVEADKIHKERMGCKYTLPNVKPAHYIHPTYLASRGELYKELEAVGANVIVALGDVAAWALLDDARLGKSRGTITKSPYVTTKVLPTYAPKNVLKTWSFRAIACADLTKAAHESQFPEIVLPSVEVWIEPELVDIQRFIYAHLDTAKEVTVDIETDGRSIITCIGFSVPEGKAICIPLVDRRNPNFSYWKTLEDEVACHRLIRYICSSRANKVLQNGLFDVQHMWRHGWVLRNFTEDTMVKHHSQQPELKKGLGFLGSIYTNYPSWKQLRTKVKTEKPDG